MKLIVITPPGNTSHIQRETQMVNRMFQSGLEILHLRKPKWSSKQLVEYIEGIHDGYRNRIMLHSHHFLVDEKKLRGRHFPERECPGFPLQDNGVVSTSFHALTQTMLDDYGSLDYAFLSPIFESISKPGYTAAFTDDELRASMSQSSLPLAALGGITPQNINQVKDLGFWGAAVLGYIWSCEDYETRLELLLRACAE